MQKPDMALAGEKRRALSTARCNCRGQLQVGHSAVAKLRLLCIVIAVSSISACARQAAPPELAGLWSRSLAACAAGLGVTFRDDAVSARFGGENFVLLSAPHYRVTPMGASALVRIEYQLPDAPGGVSAAPGRGVVEIERTPGGRLTPHQAWFLDRQTGTARAGLTPGPLQSALDLGLCPPDTVLRARPPEEH
jgi:hypothetical protein